MCSSMTRRHWMGHLASTALGVPAIQFFSSLQANGPTASQDQPELHRALDGWRPEPSRHLGPEARQREKRRPVQADRHLGPGGEDQRALPKVAKQMHHLNIIRSLDSKEGNHDRGNLLMHTGYTPNPTVVHPGFGLVLCTGAGRAAPEFRPAALHRDQLAGCRRRVPGDVVRPVRRPEPERADRQSEAPQGRRTAWRMERRLHMLGQVENQFAVTRASPGGR